MLQMATEKSGVPPGTSALPLGLPLPSGTPKYLERADYHSSLIGEAGGHAKFAYRSWSLSVLLGRLLDRCGRLSQVLRGHHWVDLDGRP
jgi:hypothetical protein